MRREQKPFGLFPAGGSSEVGVFSHPLGLSAWWRQKAKVQESREATKQSSLGHTYESEKNKHDARPQTS